MSSESATARHAHDHAQCEGHGGARLHGVRLTPGRRVILDMLCAAGKPLRAYDMIDRLAESGRKRAAPITVYRALDFLVEHGLVHRLASRNAFLACSHRHEAGEPLVFMICDACGTVQEQTSPAIRRDLDGMAQGAGFALRSQVIELAGLC
ncbi:MAG: Fur family transcriptional regulator, partial [Alphaproteobacteria bacterium]|nr:Fur family transcriptional regulator [Alphaproteobacteria bacterium]